jgi:hypothetical protein
MKKGRAPEVRHIDPAAYVPAQPKPESFLPRSEAELASAKRRRLARQACGITGIKVVSSKQTFNRFTRRRDE